MAYDDNQNEFPLEGENEGRRQSARHLPRYFRTHTNKKFLSSTLDQLMQPGVAEKLNGYVGREIAKAYRADDSYIKDVSQSRENYQLEPAAVIKDELGNVNFYKDYNDYVNQVKNFNGNADDHSLLNGQEFYAWNPNIDWDKFVNFREYYWLPNGPQTINVIGQTDEVISEYTVTLADNVDNYQYLFSPDGFTQNPSLTLYRGMTYRFNINTPGLPFTIKTNRNGDDEFLLEAGINQQKVEEGVIELKLNSETPDVLYYVADNDVNAGGRIKVLNLEEATSIDVETEILGKRSYTTSGGVALSNGMKLSFIGNVTPAKYATGQWYVEGVGEKIVLVDETKLTVASVFADDLPIEFDNAEFDQLPFDEAIGYPAAKDYFLINRASVDGNLWSRYNRWFHKSVIEESAKANNQLADIDQDARAKRPIIEFNAGLKLSSFGTQSKLDIDLVDDFTVDIFSTIEGSEGYNIDGVDLAEGMRVLFKADTDELVKNRIYEINFINFVEPSGTVRQINLKEVSDTQPILNETVLVKLGTTFGGSSFYYNGESWNTAQEKKTVNQCPLFDVFDKNGYSYSDTNYYDATTFTGTKLFSYKEGTGTNDTEIDMPIAYRTIDNVGDITFNFNLLKDTFNYQEDNTIKTLGTDVGYVRRYSDIDSYVSETGWKKSDTLSNQPVLRQYVFDNSSSRFKIDVYDESASIDNLWTRVYLNNRLQFEGTDFNFETSVNNEKEIVFTEDLTIGDVIVIKTRADKAKNENGYYELPINFEKNPLNNDIFEFTLGEVNDHVASIVEELDNFKGVYPGPSNLRDAGLVSKYGKRFVKHSAPLNLSLFHLLDKNSNIIKSLRYARREYGKFKRQFLQTANSLGFEGATKEHVDRILADIVKDKTNRMPFYFSDMIPLGAAKKTSFTIDDADSQRFFALSNVFDITTPSRKAVQVYLNGTQLLYKTDYTFNADGFVVITANKAVDDIVDIYEYESTNGSYCPPTPTKLGLYPKYEPEIYTDHLSGKTIIQGHDGSRTVGFDDFRDNLLLELERRIYNNIKVEYDTKFVDIHEFVNSEDRLIGFDKSTVDDALLADFIQWTQLVDDDFTENPNFERTNGFTWNYSSMTSPQGNPLPGYWRAIYKKGFDTDRPNTHPWEMLGFTIKPSWWEDQYGPAPYTRNNLLLWEDLEKGIIREPGKKFQVNKKYVRTDLTKHIPVDEDGNLIPPSTSGYAKNFITNNIKDNFEFGDEGPVEAAWRNSSEYPFALMVSWLLTQPSKLFSVGFDRINQVRNNSNELVYKTTDKHIRLEDIVFPNTAEDEAQIFTSGLINYVAGYMAANITTPFKDYKSHLVSVKNQIGFKLGGFTEKEKFKLILDSRTPLNQGNVFVPEENYDIFLNTSTPVETISYSGVIVEKQSNGYVIRGYDLEIPSFTYYKAIALDNDPVINVGGVSEEYVTWESNRIYVQGTNVEYEGAYYRTVEQHTSGPSFDNDKFKKLPNLPLIGGREATFKRTFFERSESKLNYGTTIETVQGVVDFLLGYEKWLVDKGFRFDGFDPNDEIVNDWRKSAKEFMFWTLQNWAEGSVITLSPAARGVKFISDYSMVDNIFDSFYGYTLYKADGKKLVEEFSSLSRENPNEFTLETKNTEDGIFAVKLPLVQKEHVVLLDNSTVFSDIIYDLEPGYRQERIRVLGYRTTDWDGSLNVPGFIYDEAKIVQWEPWTDYAIGDIVKYKEFYYAADSKIPGVESFDSSQWNRLASKPETKLHTNFEYKTNQFADYYDLDTDNFDVEQQKFAQHLIGYQNRTYLANIINDDVSQYKFYQGMIADKGTQNALTKLFDVLGSANKDSLEFYEEWAVKAGQYGAADGFEEVDFALDEKNFRLTPQPIILVNNITGDETDLIYRIRPFEVYEKPAGYDHKPFPSKYVDKGYTKDSGYVNLADVKTAVSTYDDIASLNFADIKNGDYIWVGNEKLTWNVYKHVKAPWTVESVEGGDEEFTITVDATPSDISKGDIIGLFDLISTEIENDDSTYETITQTTAALGGFYKIKDILLNKITLETSETVDDVEKCKGQISRLVSARHASLEEANTFAQDTLETNDLLWIDQDDTNNWTVLRNKDSYTLLETVKDSLGDSTDQEYGTSLAANKNNTVLAVGAPNLEDGKVFVYRRGSSNNNWRLSQVLEANNDFADAGQRFGESIALSEDGKYLIVGSPSASNVKSKFSGAYQETRDYDVGDIVQKDALLWRATEDLLGSEPNIIFKSFESTAQIIQELGIDEQSDESIDTIFAGNYPFEGAVTDHILIRAPKEMYDGSAVGDEVALKWNSVTYANQNLNDLTALDLFQGTVSGVDGDFISNTDHEIMHKIDVVLYVDAATNIPNVNDKVETQGAFGTVDYVYFDGARVTLYLREANGAFDTEGSLFLESGDFVGEYIRYAPAETTDTSDVYGGYWYINTPSYTTGSIRLDQGNGLVYYDVIPQSEADPNRYYYNILDYDNDVLSSENSIHSYIRVLSAQGAPGPYDNTDPILSDKYVIRAPKAFTDTLSNGDTFDMFVPQLARYSDNFFKNPADIGLTFGTLNRRQTVSDLWDGYINFDFTKFDSQGDPFEPKVGQTVRDVTTGATAVVTYYQRNSLNVTVFVKTVTGTWSLGNVYGDNAEIEFLAIPGDPDPIYQADRVMGQTQYRGLGLDSEGIGKLIVLENTGGDIDVPTTDILTDVEYWFYKEGDVAGIPRLPSIPSPVNNDWTVVYNIPVIGSGTASGNTNEGMYSVYQVEGSVNYTLIDAFTIPDSETNLYLGSNVKIAKKNDLYRAFVHASGDNQFTGNDEDYTSWGRIYFLNQGIDEYDGSWTWEFAKDKNFVGQFSATGTYYEGNIVFHNGQLYTALTNSTNIPFSTVNWRLMDEDERTEYVGFIPNETGQILDEDSSLVLSSTESLLKFADDFDVSRNGEVLVVANKNRNTDPNEVLIYRSYNGNYLKAQTITAPSASIGFGNSVAISADGMLIAISAPFDDDIEADQGIVYIYTQTNGTFVKTQELKSRNNESAENFGNVVKFDNNTLIVGSKNADSVETTTFDNSLTTLDNDFTKFNNVDFDSGLVYVYERLSNTLIYGQSISYNNDSVDYFGRNILAVNNHIYVGLPRFFATEGRKGAVANYKKSENIWEKYRTPKATVDLDKIKSVSLYNKKEGELLQYLDYIDPIQGKIAGPAEQEISFKTYYDPATYSTGTAAVDVDEFDTWDDQQVGRVWWDLTNAKFLNPYQEDVTFSTNNWNTLFEGNSIDVYEWVESRLLPSAWDELADTEEGIAQGISGVSKYGDTVYVQKRIFDSISQAFTNKYFFWVKNKTIVPNVEWRSKSIKDVAALIADPAGQGYRFVNFISNDSFVLQNCDSLIKGTDTVLSVQYWVIEDQSINIHNQYQIITEGLETSKPHPDIERKWFDSLIGYDEFSREVPSSQIPAKQKYGILNKPRQSWFVNRTEAFKQVVERTNSVLKKNLIIDDKTLTPLFTNDPQPTEATNLFDTTVEVLADLDFVGVAKAERAVLTPTIEDGKIIRVTVTDPGRGYLKAPTVKINGNGSDAEITTVIDSQGRVTSAQIQNQGTNYDEGTIITVRRFTVLVESDETIQGKWALYERLTETRKWSRIESQAYDVSLFWNYVDWYEEGYSDFTDIDFLIDESYELQSIDDSIGDIVKISNVGTGGWLLLEKIDEQQSVDYTVNYKTVGRENGTIEFKNTLYDSSKSFVGYDSISFDTKFFDTQPIIEARTILNTIKDNLFIDELAIEYNKLFFASLRYVFAEQSYVDWAFKTSFVKAKHNAGDLREDITFNNDNLPSYEDYLEEVKPYKTKLREYLSSYEKIDNSSSVVTDFDLQPAYSEEFKKILPQTVKVVDDVLVGTNDDTSTYPNKHWLDNCAYKVVAVKVADGGTLFNTPPAIEFESDSGSGAEAVAVLGTGGKITNVVVTNPGSGYLSAPTVTINGSQEDGGKPAKLSVEIGDNVIRGMHSIVKFDRISGTFQVTKLQEQETFTGNNNKYIFTLKWPMDLRNTTIQVTVDGNLALSSEYIYYNTKDTTKGYDRYFGNIEFTNPPKLDSSIVVSYKKDIGLLSAADRVNLFYDPQTGQIGKDVAQLMDGVDYGGVEVRSFEFKGTRGWDTDRWFASDWDSYDNTYDDEIFELDGSTLALDLANVLEDGIVYNIYKNNVRIDDPNYEDDDSSLRTNPNAIMPSITGDGVTRTINLGAYDVPANDGDTFIVRKISSDGSFLPSEEEYDSIIQGGDFPYSTASGLNAEDINIDGDGFVTPTTSKGPEEVVPGQINDAVDIKVFERPTSGSSFIESRNYVGDGTTKVYDIGTSPITESSLFVKVNNAIHTDDYTVDYDEKTVTFDTAPAAGARINFSTLGTSGNKILDIDTFIGDGSTNDFLTNVRWDDNLNYYATANGEIAESVIIESDESYAVPNNVVIRFAVPPKEGAVINFGIFEGSQQSYSQVTIDHFNGDGSSTSFEISKAPFNEKPSQFYTVVKVNDTILNSGYNEIFEITTAREYQLKLYQVPVGTLNQGQVEVYINGEKQTYLQHWSFEGAGAYDPDTSLDTQAGSAVILASGKGEPGDELRVFINTDGQYRFGYFEDSTLDDYDSFVETPDTIHFDEVYDENDKITVYQFSNHDSQGIDRQNYDVVERTEISAQSENYYELRKIRNGLVPLRFDAVDAQYVWVVKNGNLLMPSVDYYVTENKRYIKLLETLDENDVIETIHFANAVVQNKFGWRQFKDMLNRNNYHRLDGTKDYILFKDLNWYDKEIELVDATDLPSPIQGKNPGVVFINGERVEYFQKDDNKLKQLRRGTLGTGISTLVAAGTEIYNQSRDTIMPYKDEVLTTIFDGDETTDTFTLDFTPTSVNEFEVFVAGKRLRKNSIQSYQFEYIDTDGNTISSSAQDSPEGDITLAAEFSISGNNLVLAEPPKANTKIIVIRRIGKLWADAGIQLSKADSDIARFLRATAVDLPR